MKCDADIKLDGGSLSDSTKAGEDASFDAVHTVYLWNYYLWNYFLYGLLRKLSVTRSVDRKLDRGSLHDSIEAVEITSMDEVDEFRGGRERIGEPHPAQPTNPVFMSRVTSRLPWIID